MARETQGIAPGWYRDPADPTTQRWWDGEGWVGAPLPADAAPPPGPPEPTAPPHPVAERTPPVPPSPGVPPSDAIPPSHATAAPPGRAPQRTHSRRQPPPRPHGHPLATLGARLIARLIDLGLLFALNVLVNGWFVYQFISEMRPIVAEAQRRLLAGEPIEDLPAAGEAQNLMIVILIIAAALWFAYEVPAVANTGQTPGKRMLGIKVVRLEGQQSLGFTRSFRRWNTMGLPTLLWWCFGIGFLLQLVDVMYAVFDRPLQQALHDKSAQTAVVAIAPPRLSQPSKPSKPSKPDPAPAPKEEPDGPADPS